MSAPVRHEVFTARSTENPRNVVAWEVVCCCGASGQSSSVRGMVEWFGAHCYTAALDRAVVILRS